MSGVSSNSSRYICPGSLLLSDRRRTRLFLVGCALVLVPLCFLGYGTDNDTYTVLDSGVSTWHLHLPETSRNPGYWIFEAMVYLLRHVGGSLATNLATLAVAITLLWRFLVIADRLGVHFRYFFAASLAVTPVFAIAATSTVDYLWSLLGLVLFVELVLEDRLALAILPAAFAFAIRSANGPLIAGALLGAIIVTPRRAPRLLAVGFAAAMLGGLPMIESYRLANHSFAFTQALSGPDSMWSARMRAGRFLYKSLFLFGPIASAIMIGCAILASVPSPVRWEANSEYRARAMPILLGIIFANALLFLRYPIEISYLIPAAFFLLLLLGTRLERKSAAIAVFLAILSLNFVTPQFARPNNPGHATGAALHPSVEPGILIEDIRLRLTVRQCEDYRCFFLVFHPGSHALDYTGPVPSPIRAPIK